MHPLLLQVETAAAAAASRREFDNENFEWSRELSRTLERVFGHRQFRQNQRAVVNATMSRRDVFVIMPTGGGKSLCYQLPAMLEDGLTVVVCPLISLIQDQVQAMRQQGVSADFLSGSQSQEESSNVFAQLWRGDVGSRGLTLLYVTPERIVASPGFSKALHFLHGRGKLKRFVVDEAHCVSHWYATARVKAKAKVVTLTLTPDPKPDPNQGARLPAGLHQAGLAARLLRGRAHTRADGHRDAARQARLHVHPRPAARGGLLPVVQPAQPHVRGAAQEEGLCAGHRQSAQGEPRRPHRHRLLLIEP